MPEYMLKALFMVVGLGLLRVLAALLPCTRNPLGRFSIHGIAGLAALLMANAVGTLFGVGLGLNAITLPVSAGMGIPGVALLWFLRYFV